MIMNDAIKFLDYFINLNLLNKKIDHFFLKKNNIEYLEDIKDLEPIETILQGYKHNNEFRIIFWDKADHAYQISLTKKEDNMYINSVSIACCACFGEGEGINEGESCLLCDNGWFPEDEDL